jgi:hypothetical protein
MLARPVAASPLWLAEATPEYYVSISQEEKMKDKTVVIFAVIALSLAGLACSFGGATKAPEQAVATIKAAATDVKGAAGTPEPTSKPGATSAPSTGGGDGPLSLQSRQAGLDQLKSYRINFTFEWKSTETGNSDSGSLNWLEEYSSDPQGLHWVLSSQDSTKTLANNIEFWQIGNTTYMQTNDQGKAQCFSFSSEDQKNQLTKGLFSPDMLGNVSNAKYVGTETVNNVKTKHYQYDKAATLTVFGQVSGDIWVATDGGYVVKEQVNFTGGRGLFSSTNAKGDGKWLWELTDADQPVAVKAPDNCGGAGADLPVMEDAVEKTTMGDMITYKSPSKLADVAAFYQKQMPAAGWTAQGDPQITDEFAQLEFSKDGQTAQIMLSVESDKTSVLITVAK